MNEQQNAERNALLQLLAQTDYKALKYAEGIIAEDDYTSIKSQRQAWRDEINRLEAAIALSVEEVVEEPVENG